MSWDSIVDQARVKDLLRGILLRGRLGHAYLFSGPEGVGKAAAAIELAKVVNCEESGVDACDRCPSCARMLSLQHPNIHLIFPLPAGKGEKQGDAPLAKLSDEEVRQVREQLQLKAQNPYHPIALPKANAIKISSVRQIRREAALMSFSRGMKVFILLDAENLNDESSNALLKTLEEPPERTLLILTTPQPDRLLPTILSRCQQIRFGPLSTEAIRDALAGREQLPPADAELLARLAGGSYGRALQLVHAGLREKREEAVAFLRAVLAGSRADILARIERLSSDLGKAGVEEFLLLLQAWLRDALLLQSRQSPPHHQGNESGPSAGGLPQGFGGDQALMRFASHYRTADLAAAMDEVERGISLLAKNVYIPLVLMTLALKLRNTITAGAPSTRGDISLGS